MSLDQVSVTGLPAELLGTMTRRRLLGTITSMATPIVLGQLSQTMMGLVDTLMVGRLGESALAAVAVATLLFSAVAMSIKSVDVATQTFTAHRIGEGRDSEVGAIVATAVAISISAGALFMLLGLFWPEILLGLVSRDSEVVDLGSRYLIFRYAGILPLILFFQFKGMFDGIGWTRLGMGVGIGMNVLNAGLNWVLIFGHIGFPAMGVAGAALASTISAFMAAAVIIIIALRPKIRHRFQLLHRSNFQPTLIRPFLNLAWPPAVQTLGIILGFLIFYFILGHISILAVAAGNVVMRIAAVSFMPGVGVGGAVQTLVGQSMGRGDLLGARRIAWSGVGLSMVLMGIFGIIFWVFPANLLRFFTHQENLVAAGTPILRIMALVQLIDAVGITLAGALRGAGATRPVMLLDVGLGFGLMPPLAYLFGIALGGGLMGAWLAMLTWFSLYAIGMVWLFLNGFWEGNKV